MKELADYILKDKIKETKKTLLYRAKGSGDEKDYLIRFISTQKATPSDIAHFKNKYNVLKGISHPGIIPVHDVIKLNDRIAIVCEYFDGISLKKKFDNSPVDLSVFLKIAVNVSDILSIIHHNNIFHGNIRPHTIFTDSTIDVIKISGLVFDSILMKEFDNLYEPKLITEVIPYISPEQTGRMNRDVDYRTDFYSLGVTFYKMLTGRHPFEYNDPIEFFYAHMAREPIAPHVINRSIPEVISQIILKLMAKTAEERYQSSSGLMADLVRCREELEPNGRVSFFRVGEKDIPIKFMIPDVIVGREVEKIILLEPFQRIVKGSREMLLVSGEPGVGKSALMREIYKPIAGQKGFFLKGKFTQFRKDVPYSALIQAFTEMMRQILAMPQPVIDEFKISQCNALEINGKVITDVIPLLETIIGKQPVVPTLGPEESRNRFEYIFLKFIGASATKDHPIVLFIDDLQWADSGTLRFIEHVITGSDIQFFYLIGSYRNTDVDEEHQLMETISRIENSGTALTRMHLEPLSISAINELMALTFFQDRKKVKDLATIVTQKTLGNPFFARQFLHALYEDGIIQLDMRNGWMWDVNKAGMMDVTENVVDLLVTKLQKLAAPTQELMKISSCIGNRFDLETLAAITEKSIEEVLNDLMPAVHECYVFYEKDIYKFAHDKIYEATYSLVSPEEKLYLHTRIGRFELARSPADERNDKIYYIADQLNHRKNEVTDSSECLELANLNLKAGRRAKSNAAYDLALRYFVTGTDVLPLSSHDGVDWNDGNGGADIHTITLALNGEAAEAAYQCHDYPLAEKYSSTAIRFSRTVLEQVPIYSLKIKMLMAQNRLQDAIDNGLHILALLRFPLPRHPGSYHIIRELVKVAFLLRKHTTDTLLHLPVLENKEIIAATEIIADLFSIAYWGNQKLLAMLVLKGVYISAKYGQSESTPIFFIGYAHIQHKLGDENKSYAYGKMGQRMAYNQNHPGELPKILFMYNAFIRHWKEHLKATLKSLQECSTDAMAVGDMEYMGHSLMVYSYHVFLCGLPLDEVNRIQERNAKKLQELKQFTDLNIVLQYNQLVHNLIDTGKKNDEFSGTFYNTKNMLEVHKKEKDATSLMTIYAVMLFHNCYFNNYEAALEIADLPIYARDGMSGASGELAFYFFETLARVSVNNKYRGRARRKNVRMINENRKKMKKWAAASPENAMHKFHLIEAEICNLNDKHMSAVKYYELAISGAFENGYINDQALACECAGRFWLRQNNSTIARNYLMSAYDCYAEWGAKAKLKQMEISYENIIGNLVDKKNAKQKARGKNFDLATIIKLTQAISRELGLKKLFQKSLSIIMQNAGATRGIFIVESESDKKLYIQAEGRNDAEPEVLQNMPIENRSDIPLTIIQFVHQSGENFIFNRAQKDSVFINDPYIVSTGVNSILCMPVYHKGREAAIMYLENNLMGNVFTPEGIEILQILLTQASISIENYRLMSVEKEKAVLTREIEMAQVIQNRLLPHSIPKMDNARVAYKYVPKMGVGGDFVDIRHDTKKNVLGLFICDVVGHGVFAAFLSSMTKMALASWEGCIENPEQALLSIRNQMVNNLGDNFITACICSLDLSVGELTIGTAGHPPVIIVRASGRVELVSAKGRMFNLLFPARYESKKISLNHGDRIILYTDGITEAKNSAGNMIGDDDDYFCRWIGDVIKDAQSPEEMCEKIYAGTIAYCGNSDLDDDFTILVAEFL